MTASPPAAPGMPSEEEIREIVDDALNSAIAEPWEVSAHATQRILSLISPAFEAKDAEIAVEKERADMAVTQMMRQNERVREMALLLDKQMGTPCEQIRHQQEIEALQAKLAQAVEALEPFARADRAIGDHVSEDATFRLETNTGYRGISREAFRRARSASAAARGA